MMNSMNVGLRIPLGTRRRTRSVGGFLHSGAPLHISLTGHLPASASTGATGAEHPVAEAEDLRAASAGPPGLERIPEHVDLKSEADLIDEEDREDERPELVLEPRLIVEAQATLLQHFCLRQEKHARCEVCTSAKAIRLQHRLHRVVPRHDMLGDLIIMDHVNANSLVNTGVGGERTLLVAHDLGVVHFGALRWLRSLLRRFYSSWSNMWATASRRPRRIPGHGGDLFSIDSSWSSVLLVAVYIDSFRAPPQMLATSGPSPYERRIGDAFEGLPI